ncbi:unnamed protein product [Blepharisma stoltei]|uniref:Methyltransferase type 11 domain-containing protein n=1 Tax=Blepharisma stoltei TaxID=1481888 RepID=A0AAU9K0R5_9CILI|nr:unnamed protein product [Blepharisma stoltei]
MTAPSNEQLRSVWNSTVDWYISTAETLTSSIYHSLLPVLNLKNAHKIAEAACGSGKGISILLSYLPPEAEVWANDLSDLMIEKALERHLPRTHFIQASNDALPYEDNFFDRYIANLSLMLVPDANTMLREAYRILALGGIAVFSVWGRRENCTSVGLLDKANSEIAGEDMYPAKRSPFYLNDQDALKQMVRDAGFSKTYSYYTAAPQGPVGVEESLNFFSHFPKELIMKSQNEETDSRILARLRELVSEISEREELLMFEALVIVAHK